MLGLFWGSMRQNSVRQLLANVEISATRVLLALKACQTDTGKLPDSLEALVPDYIEAVPEDPFDGKPLKYSAEKKVVYSVGVDLKDAGGVVEKPETPVMVLGQEYWSPFDQEPSFPIEF